MTSKASAPRRGSRKPTRRWEEYTLPAAAPVSRIVATEPLHHLLSSLAHEAVNGEQGGVLIGVQQDSAFYAFETAAVNTDKYRSRLEKERTRAANAVHLHGGGYKFNLLEKHSIILGEMDEAQAGALAEFAAKHPNAHTLSYHTHPRLTECDLYELASYEEADALLHQYQTDVESGVYDFLARHCGRLPTAIEALSYDLTTKLSEEDIDGLRGTIAAVISAEPVGAPVQERLHAYRVTDESADLLPKLPLQLGKMTPDVQNASRTYNRILQEHYDRTGLSHDRIIEALGDQYMKVEIWAMAAGEWDDAPRHMNERMLWVAKRMERAGEIRIDRKHARTPRASST